MALSQLSAAPSVQEQANYDAACVEAVDAVNAYRIANGRTALVPLVELCRAAREHGEFEEIGFGVSDSIFNRAWNAGYAGTFLTGTTAFASRAPSSAATLFHNLLSTPGNSAAFLHTEAAYIGVGMALKMEGRLTEYRLRIVLGKAVPGGPTGQESATGRGILDLALLREIRAGAWAGNSINGFVRDPTMIVLTVAEERAFLTALATFARSNSSITIPAGRGVSLRLPPQVAKLIERIVLKGRIPPGIRYDRRTNSFKGAARGPGTYTVTLSGDLKGPVKGSEKLKPIVIRFVISG